MSPLTFGPAAQLTSGPGVDLRPNWTPDSRSVVSERLLGGTRGSYQVLADGSGLTDLTLCNLPGTNATARPAFYGPNAFVNDRGGRPALWRCKLADGTVTPLVRASQAYHGPSTATISGSAANITASERQTVHVHQQNTNGGTPQLTSAAGAQDQPWLLPDAGAFVYRAQEDRKNLICLQPIESGAARVCLIPFPGSSVLFAEVLSRAAGRRQRPSVLMQAGVASGQASAAPSPHTGARSGQESALL